MGTLFSGAFFIAFAITLLGLVLFFWAQRQLARSGLPQAQVIYTDMEQWRKPERSFFSHRYQLVGKPDFVLQQGNQLIPVEVKPRRTAIAPYPSDIMQLAAYCLLLEEHTGTPPTYGLLRYQNHTFRLSFTSALRQQLLQTLDDMRSHNASYGPDRSHQEPARCQACGVRYACDQKLA
ncbi:MAG: Dna2/Cas4 domain-containing protein [Chloroflexi bacterium]|nr:Dna2/Cas4 domain-containing protein [Chloroflexota bacterium]